MAGSWHIVWCRSRPTGIPCIPNWKSGPKGQWMAVEMYLKLGLDWSFLQVRSVYKSNQNCHYKSSLYNEYILIKKMKIPRMEVWECVCVFVCLCVSWCVLGGGQLGFWVHASSSISNCMYLLLTNNFCHWGKKWVRSVFEHYLRFKNCILRAKVHWAHPPLVLWVCKECCCIGASQRTDFSADGWGLLHFGHPLRWWMAVSSGG
jgi:hypothetical protein